MTISYTNMIAIVDYIFSLSMPYYIISDFRSISITTPAPSAIRTHASNFLIAAHIKKRNKKNEKNSFFPGVFDAGG